MSPPTAEAPRTLSRSLRLAVASAAIAYHLAVMVLVPNHRSRVTEALGPWLYPYANQLGLHTHWILFAPEPATPTFYAYRLEPPVPGAESAVFPRARYPSRQMKDRRVTLMTIAADFPPVRDLLLGWLCATLPRAESLAVLQISVLPPAPEEVEAGVPLNDLSRHSVVWNQVFSCAAGRPQ